MSTCGSSLRHIFESTIHENSPSSSLIESLSSSLKQIRPVKPPLEHSFTEIFGELHFREKSDLLYSSPNVSQGCTGEDKWWNNCTDDNKKNGYQGTSYHMRSDSFSSLNSESLQLCTEGLGSESLDYVEDLKIEFPGTWQSHNKNDENNSNDSRSDNYSFMNKNSRKLGEKVRCRAHSGDQYRKRRTNEETFPPPISCIGKTGKPSVWFQSFRKDGRFVLKEVKIPTYEHLHASREDGNLRLRFIQPSDQDDDDDDDDISEFLDEEDEGGEEPKEENEVRGDIERGHS
ncbi:hypothetical protein vseg_010182 [Gypsophila vaccaria]